jgi:hypothetical protein
VDDGGFRQGKAVDHEDLDKVKQLGPSGLDKVMQWTMRIWTR